MFIEAVLPAARDRLAMIRDDAPLVDAAALLSHAQINLVVVCDSAAALAGVVTKTDVVRIAGLAGRGGIRGTAAARLCARHRLPVGAAVSSLRACWRCAGAYSPGHGWGI